MLSRFLTALILSLALPGVAPSGATQAPRQLSVSEFAGLSTQLSEPSGYFDTDNLISNESSYLHVLPSLERRGVRGGVYLGVGPDQNFSYIAKIRPEIAFLIDIRRDNLLEHLLFKSLFALSRNRLEYLCLLFGRPTPRDVAGWSDRSVTVLVGYIDSTAADREVAATSRDAVRRAVRSYGIPLSEEDLLTIERFHRAFIAQGPRLKMTTFNRPLREDYPDYRRLALEKDAGGRQASFLASEEDFQFVRTLEGRHLIVPLVGNLAGKQAMGAVARWVSAHRLTVSAAYTSNVEFYLFGDGTFAQFAANLAALPHDERSVIIRSFFLPFHPEAVAGYNSVQLLGSIEGFLRDQAGRGYRSYRDLISRNVLERN